MGTMDREFMRVAIEAARKSVGNPTDPRVGALAVLDKLTEVKSSLANMPSSSF
jgi:hypothetical protein